MPRVKEKKNIEEDFSYLADDMRFGTPKEVADYRAKRLSCDRLIEIGAGVGFQTIAFARTCKEVVAIEIDPRKAKLLSENMEKRGVKNVTVITGDGLDKTVIRQAGKADNIFVDTERPANETERTLDSIQPSVRGILSAYTGISKGICIEVPPHLYVDMDCENEYISLNGRLNRQNIYFGELKRCDRSAVLLPSGERIEGTGPSNGVAQAKSARRFNFLYEINPALVLADLVSEVAAGMKLIFNENKQYLLSAEEKNSPFLMRYKILLICGEDYLLQNLKKIGCGKVVIRYNVDPTEYWKERNKFEKQLQGDYACHIFKFGEEMVVCEADR
jgi:hypothetical protein